MDRPGWERMFAQPGVPAPDASSTSSASEDQEEGEEEVPERYEGDMFGSDDEYKGWLDQIPSPTMPQAFGGRTSVASPFSAGPPRNCLGFWERNHQATLRKMAIDCAKSGYVHKLAQMFREHDPAVFLLPPKEDVGPHPSLHTAVQASGCAAAIDLVEEAFSALLFKQLRAITNGQVDVEENNVQQILQAGANLSRPHGSDGLLPLQELCSLSMQGELQLRPLVARRVAQAAAQLVQAAPLALILAWGDQDPKLPLEAAALNRDFGEELVPVLSAAVGRLLLQRPALCAAPLLRKAQEAALARCPESLAVQQLASLICSAAPCLDGVSAATAATRKRAIWEPNCAFESWSQREKRLRILEPLIAEVGKADVRVERAEAMAKLGEMEQLLELKRRQHGEQIAQLQLQLDKAQRAAEEASARARVAQMAAAQAAGGTTGDSFGGAGDSFGGLGGEAAQAAGDSPGELLRNIRQQRGHGAQPNRSPRSRTVGGLDLDYDSVPAKVRQSALALQRSVGAAVERLAVDLYASRGHFLLELIQNADDNRYRADVEPQISMHLNHGQDRSLFFAAVNNELGMTSKDVEALCDINRSTKPSQEGKIGKKGVGWKAVFAVSDQPTVLSGAFRFCFDVRHRGRLGYVTPDELSLADVQKLPSLLQEASANTAQAATVLYLPLRGGPPTEDGSSRSSGTGDRGLEAAALIRSSVQRLLACPTWLLFLRQLRRVAWQDATGHSDSRFQNVSVERRGDSLLIRSHSEGATQLLEEINYFVHRKKADVPKELLPAGVDEKRQEEVVIAFRKEMEVKEKSEADPVFCFLPVRAVGFRFSLQAPWALTSNREDFHLEDPRNVWLRAVAAEALAEAITASRRSNVLSLLDARQVLEPFWRRLLEDAVKSLGDAPVVPVVGENQLYRPSEVLVPPQALVRCPGAMRFLQSLAPGLWPLATGKRLASVEAGEGTEVAEENARRLLSLKAEPLTGRKMKLLVNCASRELQQSCRAARASNLLSQLLELLNALLQAASQPEGEIPAFFKAKEGEGPERLVDLVAELQQIKVIPLDMGHTQEPVMTSLAEGDVFLPSPGAGSWCPGLDKATASALLPHKGIRVFDAQAWRMLPTSSQGLLRQLGIREATLMEAAATVVRVHALQLDESARLAEFSSSFAKPGSEAAAEAEAELQVMWAGLEAVRSARESCLTSSGMPVAQAESKLNPAECCAPIFGPEKSPLQLGAAALGSVLWLATRSVEGSLLLRRAPALSRPSFLGVAVESPDLAANEEDIQEQVPGESPGLRPAPSKPPVAMPAPSSTSAQDSFENALRWEAFLADLTTVQPAYGTIPLGPVAERLVCRQFWEGLAKSADLRRHACRLFRENESWLPDLEVPVPAGQPGPGPRISSYFRRGDFEPVVGEAGLPYIDAPDVCKPLLEMLRIRCTADFESLAVALSCWVAKEPPPMCAPKGLMHALLSRAISERPAASLLMNLKSKIFLPGKGPIEAHQAIWSAGDSDFVRRACDLADAPVLQDIYGEALKCWFCDFLNVRTSPGVFQLLQVLRRLVPAQAGGTPPSSSKPTLSFLRQLYAELFFQLQEGLRASEVLEQKRRRLSVSATEGDSLPAHVARIFKDSRFIILPQARGRPWKFLTSGTAYWCVDPALADLPCSKFALSNFYDVKVRPSGSDEGAQAEADLKAFFVEVLGITDCLTHEELAQRFSQERSRPAAAPNAASRTVQRREARASQDAGSSGEDDSDDSGSDSEDDGALGAQDLLGEDGLLSILPPDSARAGGRQEGSGRRTERTGVASSDVDDASLRSLLSRCCQRTRAAQAGEAMYTGASSGQKTAGTAEVGLRRVLWSQEDVSLYACGPSDFLASPQALQEVGLALAKRQASVPKGSLLASEGLARRAADFAEAVLRPLARFFQVPLNSLAVAVGPSIGRGRNVHGLICFSLPDGDQRSNLCLWFCEMCRLLASNAAGEDFSMGEVASALTAQHMKQFLQFQATARRRRR
ncbi:unnamed protein product [Effrenium voratum]|uniref:Sacsin/Nov domain-containing protein n=1 Tax=Effrenium voratum TaxID=2562239 RepID=A0AA36NJW2_9DINO|nr:unnamed protein product [Effrenium voratum]